MSNKVKTVLAAALIVLGVAVLGQQGLVYAGHERDASRRAPSLAAERPVGVILLPPVLGAISLIAGIALLLIDTKDLKRAATP